MAQNNKSNKNKQPKQAQQQQQSGKKNAQQTASQQKKKSNAENKKCGCCAWLFGIFVLIALIAGALIYDTNVNGKGVFARSAAGKALQNAGLLPHVEKAWYATMSTLARAYKWAEVHVPPYAEPLCKLFCDLYKLGRNAVINAFHLIRDFVVSKIPVVAEFLEKYIPGSSYYFEQFLKYCTLGCEFICNFLKASIDWGQNFYEKGQYDVLLNNTKNAVVHYYHDFRKAVDSYAKLK